jgi:tRNA(fMet)-specific endonuclease VapC
MLYLLDSNVCIDVLRGRAEVVDRLQTVSPDDCAVSSITVFELLAGAQKSAHPNRETEKVQRFVDMLVTQPFDDSAAAQAATIRVRLDARGERIGAYDTLIAGHAMALGLICITDNLKEFSRVDGLAVENWRTN